MKYTIEVYKSKGQWRWRMTANNGKIIAASTEAYKARAKATLNLAHVTGFVITPARKEKTLTRYFHSADLKVIRFVMP